jgi:hypothetical protein
MRFGDKSIFFACFLFIISLGLGPGCDSGKKAVDEATGNRALKQYKKAKENLKKIEEKQKERDAQVPVEEEQENPENEKSN